MILRRVQHAVPDPGENACTVDLNRSLRSPVDWIAPNRAAALVLSRPLEIKILFLDALHDVTIQELQLFSTRRIASHMLFELSRELSRRPATDTAVCAHIPKPGCDIAQIREGQ